MGAAFFDQPADSDDSKRKAGRGASAVPEWLLCEYLPSGDLAEEAGNENCADAPRGIHVYG